MHYTFSGNSVLVTGAASGIGEATARLLAANGLSVVVSDIQAHAVQRVVDAISADGGRAVGNICDVAKPDQVQAAVESAQEHFGALHYAVNNAGIGGQAGAVGEMSLEAWQRVIDINLNGVAYGLRYQIPAILAAGGGAVVNMSSILGLVGIATAPGYNAAKHAVTGLTRSTALAYSASGIRVNSIHPGYVETPILDNLDPAARTGLVGLHPIGRLGHAEEIAHAIAFLLSDGASFVTGAALAADGGYTAQ
ncbi:SDR family NAD(P)-dependent oxidoreductase [Coralloluteibacterium stylophorae]|uniref:SDR family oxidoreductase n=1 Tax=Coralloluteibacterium stylophorae TaxID=1776034 RepID=A0A8J8AXQ1_9GAMM|nr:SDR family oxidoreductase [Coralloluteibacterium stylophorae]MBS7457270.1 SDR family oxidoreductase [Coralloluteibacterium stylophorae]